MGRQSAHRSAPLAAQLLAATREGDLLRLHLLLKNNTAEGLVNEQLDCHQRTALNEAVELGNEAVVVLLLAQCVAWPELVATQSLTPAQQGGPPPAKRGGQERSGTSL